MRHFLRAYDALIRGLAYAAAAIFLAIGIAIVGDVITRNIGIDSPQAISSLIEYALLVATMAGSPWLVRTNGHVTIDSFINILPPSSRAWLRYFTVCACLALCLGLAWYALEMSIDSYMRGDLEIRSFDMPRWIPFFCLFAGFLLIATEFLRLVLKPDARAGTRGGNL